MRNKLALFALSILAVLCLVGWTSQAQRPQWEYKTEFHGTMSEKKLNELGAQGWELIAIGREPAMNSHQTFYFKRPKQ